MPVVIVQRLTPKRCEQVSVAEGLAPAAEERATPPAYLELASPLAAKLARLFERSLRWVSVALWLSPLLLVPKAMFNVVDPRLSDAVTLLFVALVLGFFSILISFIVFRLVTGSVEEQEHVVLVPFTEPKTRPRAARIPRQQVSGHMRADSLRPLVGKRIRVRGVLTAFDRSAGEVLRDSWAEDGEGYSRMLLTRDAAVETAMVPVRLDLSVPPLVVAEAMDDEAHARFRALPERAQELLAPRGKDAWLREHLDASTVMLRDGDEIEVEGWVDSVLEDASDLISASGPRSVPSAYRAAPQGQAGLVLRSTATEPMILRRVAGAGRRR